METAIISVIVVTVVVFPLVYAVPNLSEGARELIRSVGIFIAIFSTMCSLYGWKVVLLVQGYDYDILLQLSKKSRASATVISGVITKDFPSEKGGSHKGGSNRGSFIKGGSNEGGSNKGPHSEDVLEPLPEMKYGVSSTNPFEAMKTKNLLNRREVCRDQATYWSGSLRHTEALMLMQAEVNDSVLEKSTTRENGSLKSTFINGSLKNSFIKLKRSFIIN